MACSSVNFTLYLQSLSDWWGLVLRCASVCFGVLRCASVCLRPKKYLQLRKVEDFKVKKYNQDGSTKPSIGSRENLS